MLGPRGLRAPSRRSPWLSKAFKTSSSTGSPCARRSGRAKRPATVASARCVSPSVKTSGSSLPFAAGKARGRRVERTRHVVARESGAYEVGPEVKGERAEVAILRVEEGGHDLERVE